jgi:5-methyltetrahydrofolate--homocysteine methyltransferase
MTYVAREMERQGFELPLLIGGATTSRAHTAIKIAPAYSRPVVHVLDASRAVGVVNSLLGAESREEFASQNRRDQEALREQHAARRAERRMLSLAEARTKALKIDWRQEDIATPEFTGIRVLDNYPLEDLAPYIDWTPFFHTWELHGRFPAILEDAVVGEAASKVYADARRLLEEIVCDRLLTASGVYGLFPANRVGDDVEVYTDSGRTEILTRFHFLRQQMDKGDDGVNYSLADFVAPKESGLADHIGGFAVTVGHGIEPLKARFLSDHDDYHAILAEALADRLAEAFAERLHKRVREEWGYGKNEALTVDDLIRERYRGIRPASGYPACPDHTERRLLFDLLGVERAAGITMTESLAMHPASSVAGHYLAHPQARYFPVGKIERDQVRDYATRKGWTVSDVEKWLGPYLNYDPAG